MTTAERFEVRAATREDQGALLSLAAHLNTVNLPNQAQAIEALLEHSAQSFEEKLPLARRKLVLLLWDHELGRAAATSSVIAKLGRPDAPYLYLDVRKEEKYSAGLEKHFKHTTLHMGYSYDGPTELGGLVVHPEYRRRPEALGRFIAYSRFLLIAARRAWFESQLLAELLPPLEPDGQSHLWEAFGERFTHMTYSEADLRSSHDKDFVRDLFPSGTVYASVLSEDAQKVIGRVGEPSKPVKKMLERLGFRYARRVDPFDGGPHYVADTDDVPLVKRARAVTLDLGGQDGAGSTNDNDDAVPADAALHLVGAFTATPPYVRILTSPLWNTPDGVRVPRAVSEQLSPTHPVETWCTPLRVD